MQANATSLVKTSSKGASSSPNHEFVFPVTIALERSDVRIGDPLVPLSPGMSVTAEIKTDHQRIIDCVLSPLTQMTSEALHKR